MSVRSPAKSCFPVEHLTGFNRSQPERNLVAIEDFIEQEYSQGTQVGDESHFTLNPIKVRERVSSFCQSEALYPLLRCMQALIRVCEGDIFIKKTGDTGWDVSFRWPTCPPAEAFEQLLNLGTTAGFDKVGHRTGQHFFFGLSAALGTPHYKIDWVGPTGGFVLRQGQVKLVPAVDGEFLKLKFGVEAAWWKRLFVQKGPCDIEQRLKLKLSYSPKPIHMDQERLLPQVPQAPERPWAAKLSEGSELAWRFLHLANENKMAVPTPELDYYRIDEEGAIFHLLREPPDKRLPLSIAIQGKSDGERLSAIDRAHSAVFLSLEAGRHDWLVPISDGVLTEPTEVSIAGGGIIALTSETTLDYDLSGLKVIENDAFKLILARLEQECQAIKKQLALSLANIGTRAEKMPKQYDQAACYLAGGPYLGMLGGRFLPKVRRFFDRGPN